MEGPKTTYVPSAIRLDRPRLIVLTGPEKGREVPLDRLTVRIGAAPDNDLVLAGLSPYHAVLTQEPHGICFVDRSEGASRINGSAIREGVLAAGATLALGDVELRLQDARDTLTVLPSTRDAFGDARGRSLVMREIFGVLEAVAPTPATVLLMGETGSGKDVIARGIHRASDRAPNALETLDCGAIAPSLIESELFGYERGAFTGADERHLGAFERADGGTLFLDEIGELPLNVQPKLLRALDEQQIQRVGGNDPIAVNVRIVAATKRDLLEEVKRGRFREDLWFRLAIVPLTLPPLRERRDDVPMLVETFVDRFVAASGRPVRVPPEEVSRLQAHDWPGNVRELKNTVERALWMAQTGDGEIRFLLPALADDHDEPAPADEFEPERSFSDHKKEWEADFERRYLSWLLARADGSLSRASRLASMDRKHLRNLLRRHGLHDAGDTVS